MRNATYSDPEKAPKLDQDIQSSLQSRNLPALSDLEIELFRYNAKVPGYTRTRKLSLYGSLLIGIHEYLEKNSDLEGLPIGVHAPLPQGLRTYPSPFSKERVDRKALASYQLAEKNHAMRVDALNIYLGMKNLYRSIRIAAELFAAESYGKSDSELVQLEQDCSTFPFHKDFLTEVRRRVLKSRQVSTEARRGQ